MTKDERNYLKEWFEKAENDLLSARRLIEIPPAILDTACFHCQQAVEKYLKAYLIFKGKDIKRTHNLTILQAKCIEIDPDFEKIDLKDLKLFAVDVRYPDDALEPFLEEAKEYLQIAEEIKELVLDKIKLI